VSRTATCCLWIALALLACGPLACAGDERDATEPSTRGPGLHTEAPTAGSTPCTEPRPEMCTQHYDPVCGERSDGSRGTYSNACVACAEPRVASHRPGACE